MLGALRDQPLCPTSGLLVLALTPGTLCFLGEYRPDLATQGEGTHGERESQSSLAVDVVVTSP